MRKPICKHYCTDQKFKRMSLESGNIGAPGYLFRRFQSSRRHAKLCQRRQLASLNLPAVDFQ